MTVLGKSRVYQKRGVESRDNLNMHSSRASRWTFVSLGNDYHLTALPSISNTEEPLRDHLTQHLSFPKLSMLFIIVLSFVFLFYLSYKFFIYPAFLSPLSVIPNA